MLDELNLADNTIVIFSSDNGTTSLKEEVDAEFFESVGELRGLKGSLYEGGVRVPAIVRWPGRVPAGAVSERVSGFEDWLPTILELIGAAESVPDGIDGISFAPTLLGKEQPPRPFLYREFPAGGGQQSIRAGDWKAIRTNLASGNRAVELYELSQDPGERRNLAAEHPKIAARLTKLMESQHTPSGHFPLRPFDTSPRSRRTERGSRQ
ncbi:MAG TPA: sulfatase-like hydrolase/transferase [Planctomycetaceae bacterium]|nr:sulfatase-like hydrolase/transferase [Planctomycetaceae bacterium]